MACLTKKNKTKAFKYMEGSTESLINYNIEAPGTDCMVRGTETLFSVVVVIIIM